MSKCLVYYLEYVEAWMESWPYIWTFLVQLIKLLYTLYVLLKLVYFGLLLDFIFSKLYFYISYLSIQLVTASVKQTNRRTVGQNHRRHKQLHNYMLTYKWAEA